MKNIYLLLALAMLAAGCKKDSSPIALTTPTLELVPDQGDPLSPDSLASKIDYITANVYKGDGTYVTQISQIKADVTDFGMLTFNLPQGNYNVICFGSKGHGFTDPNPTSLKTSILLSESETYHEQFILKVPSDATVQRTLAMGKVSARGEITILDTVPANARRAEIIFMNAYMKICPLKFHYPFGSRFSVPVTAGQSNFTIPFNTMNVEKASYVAIQFADAENNLIALKTIPDILFVRNKTVKMVGKVFVNPMDGAGYTFDVSVE